MSENKQKSPGLAAIFGVVSALNAVGFMADAAAGNALAATSDLILSTAFAIAAYDHMKPVSNKVELAKEAAYTAGFGTGAFSLAAAGQPFMATAYGIASLLSLGAAVYSFRKLKAPEV